MVQAGTVEAGDQPPGLLPRCAPAGDQRAVGQRADALDPLHQDRGPVAQALAHVEGCQWPGHRQLLLAQRAHQPELGKAAGAVRAAPEVLVVADPGRHAAAQVVAQHAGAERRIDEPGAATTAFTHRAGPAAPMLGREQADLGLPQPLAVEQNGPDAATLAAWL
ncbi:hypothetical protein G6F35_014241 [Rhizopus arrhizus]|nr:hypothetical protein G6F35_014241 [Rhizopus arrhizus]